jgi:hypothetical protein
VATPDYLTSVSRAGVEGHAYDCYEDIGEDRVPAPPCRRFLNPTPGAKNMFYVSGLGSLITELAMG